MNKKSLKYIKKNYGATNDILAISTKLAPYFIKLILYTPITANQVSFFSFIFIFIPATLIAFGNYWITLLGAFLLQFIVILDYSDGTIARIKKTANHFGEYYCTFLHDFIPPVLIVALSIKSYRFFNSPLWLMIGLITVIAMHLTIYSRIIKDRVALQYQIKNNKRVKSSEGLDILSQGKRVGNKPSYISFKTEKIISNFIHFFNTFCHLSPILLLLAIFDMVHYAIIFYAPFYISIAVVKISIELKKGMKEYIFE